MKTRKLALQRFKTGAVRNPIAGKLDYEGIINPIVLKNYAEYMMKHVRLENGSSRSTDDWQKGIPKDSYMKSLLRHVMDVWLEHRGYKSRDGIKDALNGVIFNSMGYLLELLKEEIDAGIR
jgi:hypothetical protein